MSEINKINLNGTEYTIGGAGITADIKTALLQLAEKVAYIDEYGQDYYDALEAALDPPNNLSSITAVYTQSGTVYTSDTLDSLKPDLVVTAHYDDSTTATVSAYTLSGTLTAGSSTITVLYGGKTTTFSVTATAPLYPFENGSHDFTSPAASIEVSNGNKALVSFSTANQNDIHGNISEVSANTTACNSTSNYGSDTWFEFETGSVLTGKITVTDVLKGNDTTKASLFFFTKNSSNESVSFNIFQDQYLKNLTVGDEFQINITAESDLHVKCLGLYLGNRHASVAAHIGIRAEIYLDNVRIV